MIPPLRIWNKTRSDEEWPGFDCSSVVVQARKEGRLPQKPCVICGETRYTVAHHADYSKPLDVIFLCQTHHHRLHDKMMKRLRKDPSQEYTISFHDAVLADLRQAEIVKPPKLSVAAEAPYKASEVDIGSADSFSRLDVARMLGCTTDRVKKFEKSGQLTPYQWGYKMTRYPAAEVHRLIEGGRKS